jgi:hypothetical protein
VSELEQPNERTGISSPSQNPATGNWLEGYVAVWIGLLLLLAVTMVFAATAMAFFLMLWALLGESGIWAGSLILVPLWLWICFRFFFPAMSKIIWIDGRPALLAFHRVTPRRMIGVTTVQLAVLRSDLRWLLTRSGS